MVRWRFHVDGSLPVQPNTIFVFGSNLAGIHGAGAAKVAYKLFGACYGAGLGKVERSWAIPTKDFSVSTLPLPDIKRYVSIFADYTWEFADERFFVTRIGCGLAGYTDRQIAPLFKNCNESNCSFARQWEPFL